MSSLHQIGWKVHNGGWRWQSVSRWSRVSRGRCTHVPPYNTWRICGLILPCSCIMLHTSSLLINIYEMMKCCADLFCNFAMLGTCVIFRAPSSLARVKKNCRMVRWLQQCCGSGRLLSGSDFLEVWIRILKGTVQRDLRPLVIWDNLFHHSNQPGPLTNGLKYFRYWFRFCRDICIFPNFREVSYCAESTIKFCGEISAQHDTARSQFRVGGFSLFLYRYTAHLGQLPLSTKNAATLTSLKIF